MSKPTRSPGKDRSKNPARPPMREGYSRGKVFFQRLVTEAMETLPEELRERLENVAILVEEESPRFKARPDATEEELLGLYHGVSHPERGFWYGNALPDRIIIYRRPLERMSRNVDELRENVRQTVVHEVGHYFGFDEEELQALEEGEEP